VNLPWRHYEEDGGISRMRLGIYTKVFGERLERMIINESNTEAVALL